MNPMRDAMAAYREQGYRPPDGVVRSPEDERRLNLAVRQTFETDAGKQVLAWLYGVTRGRVLPLDAPEWELRALNSQSFLVELIQERIEHGRHARPSDPVRGKRRNPTASGADAD